MPQVTVTQIHLEEPAGDVLVFLPGCALHTILQSLTLHLRQEEIEAVQRMLEERNPLLPADAGAMVCILSL